MWRHGGGDAAMKMADQVCPGSLRSAPSWGEAMGHPCDDPWSGGALLRWEHVGDFLAVGVAEHLRDDSSMRSDQEMETSMTHWMNRFLEHLAMIGNEAHSFS